MDNKLKAGIIVLGSVLLVAVLAIGMLATDATHITAITIGESLGINELLAGSADTGIGANLHYEGMACVTAIVSGEKVDLGCKHNIITTGGKNMIRDSAMGVNWNKLNRLAIANNTVAQGASDTSLQGIYSTCDLGIQSVTPLLIGTGNWSVNYTWTSSCDSTYVNATGIYNETTATALFAETTFTTVTLNTNDQLQIIYYTWVS